MLIRPTPQSTLSPPTTLERALEAWRLERIATAGTKAANAAKQARRLSTLFRSAGADTYADLTRERLVEAFSGPGAGKSLKTRVTLMSMVTGFCEWACRAGHMNANPMRTIPRPRRTRQRGPSARRGMRPLSNAEVEKIVSAVLADEAKPATGKRHWRYRSLRIVLAWMTGGRMDQIRRLQWRDLTIDGEGPYSVIYDADEAKNLSGWRIPLPRPAVDMARAWRKRCEAAAETDLVFPTLPRYRQNDFDEDLKRAGVEKTVNGRRAGFHSLRKTFARNLVMSGVPVNVAQQLMQHKTLEMTLSVYAEVQVEDQIAGSARAAQHVEKDFSQANIKPQWLGNDLYGTGDNPPTRQEELTKVADSADSDSAKTMVTQAFQHDRRPPVEASVLASGAPSLRTLGYPTSADASPSGLVGRNLDLVEGAGGLGPSPRSEATSLKVPGGGLEPPTGALGGGLGRLTTTERALIAALRREEALRRRLKAAGQGCPWCRGRTTANAGVCPCCFKEE